MRVMVTGCAGFIGSNLLKKLVQMPIDIIGIDNFDNLLYPSSYKKNNLKPFKSSKNFKFCHLDMSKGHIPKKIKDVDFIFNFAALPGQSLSWKYTSDYIRNNFETVSQLLSNYSSTSAPRILHISTSSVYGENAISSEDSICSPNNPYGVTKLAAENLLRAHAMYFPLDFKILRLFSVYGPNQRPDMGIHKFLSQIQNGKEVTVYGNGNQTRDFTYIDDLTSTLLKTLLNWETIEERLFNISGGHQYSVLELIEVCEKVIGRKAIIKSIAKPVGDQQNTKSTSALALIKLGHKPETDLTSGLKLQYKSMQF